MDKGLPVDLGLLYEGWHDKVCSPWGEREREIDLGIDRCRRRVATFLPIKRLNSAPELRGNG